MWGHSPFRVLLASGGLDKEAQTRQTGQEVAWLPPPRTRGEQSPPCSTPHASVSWDGLANSECTATPPGGGVPVNVPCSQLPPAARGMRYKRGTAFVQGTGEKAFWGMRTRHDGLVLPRHPGDPCASVMGPERVCAWLD